MSRKYLESLDQEGGDVVPEGTYDIEIVDARALDDKAFVWIDAKILNGPDANRVVSVSLNIPDDDAKRGAIHFFKKKVRGFAPQFSEANILGLPDDEQAPAIAECILGVRVEADLSIQSGGDYDGSQQLEETRQLVDEPRAPATTVPPSGAVEQPAPAPITAQAADAAVVTPGDDEDLPF